METIYEQTSFLDSNNTVIAEEMPAVKSTTTYAASRVYPNKQNLPKDFPYVGFSRRQPKPVNKLYGSETEAPITHKFSNKAFTPDRTESSGQGGEVFVRKLPNKAFDQEYMTEWVREVKWLQEKGIRYVYVKKTPDYGVSQFKYKKTPELFTALAEFYSQVEKEKANIASIDEAREALKASGIEIRHDRNGNIKFIKSQENPESETKTKDVTE